MTDRAVNRTLSVVMAVELVKSGPNACSTHVSLRGAHSKSVCRKKRHQRVMSDLSAALRVQSGHEARELTDACRPARTPSPAGRRTGA